MNIPGEMTYIAIGYKYKYTKILRFIAMEGAGSNAPEAPYCAMFNDRFSNVSIRPDTLPQVFSWLFGSINHTNNHNKSQESYLVPYFWGVT